MVRSDATARSSTPSALVTGSLGGGAAPFGTRVRFRYLATFVSFTSIVPSTT